MPFSLSFFEGAVKFIQYLSSIVESWKILLM